MQEAILSCDTNTVLFSNTIKQSL